jgi:hypothetical protein
MFDRLKALTTRLPGGTLIWLVVVVAAVLALALVVQTVRQ